MTREEDAATLSSAAASLMLAVGESLRDPWSKGPVVGRGGS